MAQPTILRGSKLLIKLGDGGSPEVFTAPCALTTKSFGRSTSANEFNVADCADPDAPVWTARVKSALSSTISGSGTLAKETIDLYEAFFLATDPRNIQITIDYTVGPRNYAGAFLMTTLNITGEQDGLIQVELEFQSSGPVLAV